MENTSTIETKFININDSSVKDVELVKNILSSKYDKKHKLNTSPSVLFDASIIDTLKNEGLTYEHIIELSSKVQIYKYQTQLTIHGVFPNTNLLSIGNYNNVIVNKNGSLGLKYNTIDYQKKQTLAKYIRRSTPFYYTRNSTNNYFSFASTDFETVAKYFNQIDTDLFIGNKQIYRVSFYGMIYFVVKVDIEAFPMENMENIVLNFTSKSISKHDEEIKIENDIEAIEKHNKQQIYLKQQAENLNKRQLIDQTMLDSYEIFSLDDNIDTNKIYFGYYYDYNNLQTFHAIKYHGKIRGGYYKFEILQIGNNLDDIKNITDDNFKSIYSNVNKLTDRNLDILLKRINKRFKFFK